MTTPRPTGQSPAPVSTSDRHVPLVVPPVTPAPHADVYPTGPVGGYPPSPASDAPTYADLPVAPAAYHRADQPQERKRRKAPLAWLPWALLAGIVGLLLLGLLLASLGRDADSGRNTATGNPLGSAGVGSGASGQGDLTAGGADLLAQSTAAKAQVGDAATGNGVRVQSVVSDEGFWVGDAQNRVFVHLSKASRSGQAESPYRVRAGDRVDLTGTVQPLGATTVRDFGVTGPEGASDLTSAGAFIEARSVSLSR